MKIQQKKREIFFDHDFIQSVELDSTTTDSGRHYITPEGNVYPSVTTVLGSLDKQGIKDWVNRVGEETANKIKTQASTRGTNVHNICEKYLLNEEGYLQGHMPANTSLFKQIQPYLDKYVDKIYGIEIPLYSNELKTAGRCDLFCRMHGVRTIADFKTSTNPKKEEWIENYFLQTAAYSMMIEEMYDMRVHYTCVIIAVENGELQTFIRNPDDYKEKVRELFYNYHNS